MPIIKPFKAVRYNPAKIRDIAKVVAPPYDIIPASLQDSLYKAHPRNIVRLELGKSYSKDTAQNNRYTRAGRNFNAWLEENILIQDDKPAIYIYSQKYKYNQKCIERTGFLSLMSLGARDTDKVKPHEFTLKAPKVDRLNLMREVRANLSPIFVLYDDKYHKIMKILNGFRASHKPVIDIDFEDVRNRVWKMDDPSAIAKITGFMRNKDTFIADGHHRYEVARNYAKEAPEANYMMVYFVETDERVLTVLPAHRLIKDLGKLKKNDIIVRLAKFFNIEKLPTLNALMSKLNRAADKHAFGMYLGKGDFRLLILKDVGKSDAAIKNRPLDWKRLDVSILHMFILQKVLGIKDTEENIEFVKDPHDAVRLLDRGPLKLAFMLNPTKAAQVKKIASLGERMPRKATYFYPKPVTGLVINKH